MDENIYSTDCNSDYVRVYFNEKQEIFDSNYEIIGYDSFVNFRREHVDIKEEDIIAIPIKDIPNLIEQLNKLVNGII